MRILFSKRDNVGSSIIRAVTWSSWSHVDIVLGDYVLGATADRGVGYTRIDHRLELASRAEMVSVPLKNELEAITWAKWQVGKPYDWQGIVGLGLHRDWEEDDAWFCSEYVGKALLVGGYEPYRSHALRRLTPEHLWMLNLPTETIK
jgi:uncharacterized protein YycO